METSSFFYIIKHALFLHIYALFIISCLSAYEVHFEGISNALIKDFISSSQLIDRCNSPPETEAGLRYLAELDVDAFLRILHSQAHFGANIQINYQLELTPPRITFHIIPGPLYWFRNFAIELIQANETEPLFLDHNFLAYVGLTLNSPAYPQCIFAAEEAIIASLKENGFPLAKLEKRELIADQTEHCIDLQLLISTGPVGFFGPIHIQGNRNVKDAFFWQKIQWKQGGIYKSDKIMKTQKELEGSGLFSSISIEHPDQVGEGGSLPITIEVEESKHRSIGWGITYATQRGVGLTLEWEHRNIRGMGERLRMDTDLWSDDQEAHLSYLKPDFYHPHQNLLWLGEFQHQTTKGYTNSAFSLAGIIERQIQTHARVSFGGMYQWLMDRRSPVKGHYSLFKTPLQLTFNKVNDLLDPCQGATLQLKVTPALQILKPQFAYCINTFVGTLYYPLTQDANYVFATKATLGSILGSNRRTIPSSELFYEGNESCLRGYHYQTVSPLNKEDKPLGGRSMMIYTGELRVRATESFGFVCFYDVGNVYANPLPDLNHKLLQSVGWGLRYHTPVGPLRLDFAVPLNRRKHLDSRFQIYLSIGQAF